MPAVHPAAPAKSAPAHATAPAKPAAAPASTGKGLYFQCGAFKDPEAIAAAILAHDPLGVALTVLHIEWMVQRHYIESIKDDQDLDPQFKSLLKHHWIEEVQHAKLDTLMVKALAANRSRARL